MASGGPPFAALRTGLGTTSVVLTEAGTQVVAESRHHPYGTERWRSGTFPTDYRYTGQRQEEGLGLYLMGARWYDPALARWIGSDTIIPGPANPQSFNRYSYVNNRPLVATDPTGHDLVIVGGMGGNADMEEWKEWIMAYKGWSEWTFTEVLKQWQAAVEQGGLTQGNELLAQHGVHIFTWGGSSVKEAESNAGSAKNWEMLDQLSKEMEGMQDITLVGWSKGGNLVMEYLQKLAENQNLIKPKHAVLIAPANTIVSEAAPGIRDVSPQVPSIGINVANVCARGDRVCHMRVLGTITFNAGLDGHGPHGHIAKQTFAALCVANDQNAWREENGWR